MKPALTLFIATFCVLSFSQAVTLKTETTAKIFENTKLIKSVSVQNDDKTEAQMNHVSHGLRKKAVFGLVPVSVYVMQVLAAKPEKLVKTEEGFLNSLKEAGPVQLHLTFLRNLPGEKISNSFKDGLEANDINTKKLSPELSQVLNEISAITEFKEGESFSITLNWTTDKAYAYLTDSSLKIKIVSGAPEFANQLLSIWFGKSADGKLEELKKTLIK